MGRRLLSSADTRFAVRGCPLQCIRHPLRGAGSCADTVLPPVAACRDCSEMERRVATWTEYLERVLYA
jgi:hypothetical protein